MAAARGHTLLRMESWFSLMPRPRCRQAPVPLVLRLCSSYTSNSTSTKHLRRRRGYSHLLPHIMRAHAALTVRQAARTRSESDGVQL